MRLSNPPPRQRLPASTLLDMSSSENLRSNPQQIKKWVKYKVKPTRIHNSYAGDGPKRFEFSRDKMRLSNPASEAEIASVDMSSSEKMVVASNKNSSLISFHSDAPIRSRTFVK